jgi:LPS export ABC transporter protein LptC
MRLIKRVNNIQKACIALIISVNMFFMSCQSKVATDIPPGLLENKAIPTLDATDFETTFTDSGVVRYHLKTPRLLVFAAEKPPYKEFPAGFHLQQYDKDKKIISELSANYGKEFETEQKWLAIGNVVMINTKGDTLRTEELNYLQKEDLISSDKFVSVKEKQGDRTLIGKGGFKSDSQMKKVYFYNTSGNVYMKDQ